jgi:flagellar assembly protein FliH
MQELQRPSFLQALPELGEPRPATFGQSAPPARVPTRAAVHHGRRQDPQPPPGPSQEELAAIRAEALARVAPAVQVLRLSAERLAEQARNDALEIGFMVARRILEAELSTGPEALFALVKGALKRAGDSRLVRVRVHPSQASDLAGPAAAGQLGVTTATVEVVADPGLEPGDVVVDTDFGKVDGRLRTRFEELYRTAASALEEGAA